MITIESKPTTRTAVVAAIAVAATAIRTATRKLLRTAGAIVTVTKRHVPAWLGAVLTICLLIPGPVDELLVLLVNGAMAAFKPAMRADFRADRPAGVGRCQRRAASFAAKPSRWRPVTA